MRGKKTGIGRYDDLQIGCQGGFMSCDVMRCPECASLPQCNQTANGYYFSVGCDNGHKWIGVDVPYDAFRYLEMPYRTLTVQEEARRLWNEKICGEKSK